MTKSDQISRFEQLDWIKSKCVALYALNNWDLEYKLLTFENISVV